jgi:DNA-binding NarL/FixJ family response regulator
MPIGIAMVEDDAPFARTLREYLALSPEIACETIFPTAEDALTKVPEMQLEVLLVDINLPGMGGIELVERITTRCPGLICLMLTMYEESSLIFDALKAGACGYLLKPTPPVEIVAAIFEAKAGGSPMTPQIARQVVRFFQHPPPVGVSTPVRGDVLADREKEVLDGLAKGFLYKEIAESLQISPHTVNSHIRRIYEKLQVRSRCQAVAKYRGLIE